MSQTRGPRFVHSNHAHELYAERVAELKPAGGNLTEKKEAKAGAACSRRQ